MFLPKSTNYYKACLMWFLLALFSFFQFFIQMLGNVMGRAWETDFHASHIALSFLSSGFFYAYILVQVVAGFLYDFWGAKRIVRITSLVFALGLVLFALSHSLYLAIIARVLMGLGAGFAFVGMAYVAGSWFKPSLFIVFVGLGEMLSMILTTLGQLMVAGSLMATYGWRHIVLFLGILGILYWILVLVYLKDVPNFKKSADKAFWKTFRLSLNKVLRLPSIWLAGMFAGGMWAVMTVFASLWGGFFLEYAHGLTYIEASRLVAVIPFGMALGSFIIGLVNQRYISTSMLTRAVSFILLVLSLCLILWVNMSSLTILLLLFLIGFMGGGNILAFYVVGQNTEPSIRGISLGLCNALAILTGTIFQCLIGFLLQLFSDMNIPNKIAVNYSMLLFPCIIALAFIAAIFLPKCEKNVHS